MKIKKGFMKRKFGEKYLVVATGELSRSANIFIELNETSNDIWELIEKGCTEQEIAAALCKKYGISEEKALTDTKKLLAEMEKAGVFEKE